MKRLLLVSVFACVLGAVSLHAMEQEFPVKGKKIGEEIEKRMYIHWGTVTNETGRELKNITFDDIDPTKKVTVTQLRPNETAKLYKGPLPIGTVKGSTSISEMVNQDISISGKNLKLLLGITPKYNLITSSLSIENKELKYDVLADIDLAKKVTIQVDLILRDGPNGEPFEGSYIELHAMQ